MLDFFGTLMTRAAQALCIAISAYVTKRFLSSFCSTDPAAIGRGPPPSDLMPLYPHAEMDFMDATKNR
jgi:hypothetical protein